MNYASEEDLKKGKDELVRSHGIQVLVDPKAIFFIVGTIMNYEVNDIHLSLTFQGTNYIF